MPRTRDRAATRARPDACPGAWRRHDAADGALARFRPVGGATTAGELRLLAGAAATGGSPLELTSRGSWQVRGLAGRTADDLADALRTDHPDALLDARGRVAEGLFTLGPLRRGELWESTAVPEIRAQACALSARLLRAFAIQPALSPARVSLPLS